MGSRFRRNFGLPSRSPTRAGSHGEMLFWLGMLATLAAGLVYLYLTR